MANHFTGERHETVLAWPWRLFCAKWVRMLEAGERERKRRKKDKQHLQDEKDRMELYEVEQRLHAQGG